MLNVSILVDADSEKGSIWQKVVAIAHPDQDDPGMYLLMRVHHPLVFN